MTMKSKSVKPAVQRQLSSSKMHKASAKKPLPCTPAKAKAK